MLEFLVVLLVSALAGARLWRLAAVDTAGLPFRNLYFRVLNRWYALADEALSCPFCSGFWITAIVFCSGLLFSSFLLWQIVVGVFAANYVGAQLNAWLDVRPIEDKEEIADHD
jgi:hypothetical protein